MALPMPAAEADRYEIGPLTIPVAADVLKDWVANARPGQRLPYAYGPIALPRHPTFVLARELQAKGFVELFQPRRSDGRGFDFIIERRADPVPRPIPPRDALRAEDLRVLSAIQNRIKCGLYCPTDTELAATCRLKGADQASYSLRLLKRAGLITIEQPGPLQRRIVTDVASGKSTVPGTVPPSRARR